MMLVSLLWYADRIYQHARSKAQSFTVLKSALLQESGAPGWDPIWFLLQETLAFPCWYLIGIWADKRRRLGRVMVAILAARLLIAVSGFYDVGWRFEELFWLGFGLWSLGVGIIRLFGSGQRALTSNRSVR
jgi:hypothetical protein